MKKLLFVSMVFIVNGSCKKIVADPLLSCEKAAANFSEAATAFINDLTNTKKCEAYKAAGSAAINSCPDFTAADKAEIQKALKDISCN